MADSDAEDDEGCFGVESSLCSLPASTDQLSTSTTGRRLVLLAPADLSFATPSSLHIVQCPHPRGSGTFLIGTSGGKAYEIQRHRKPQGSWFIDQSVEHDGTLMILSEFDPCFLLLPLFSDEKTRRLFRSTSDLLDGWLKTLFKNEEIVPQKLLGTFCDRHEMDGEELYRLNEQRLLAWLRVKCNRLAASTSLLNRCAARMFIANEDDIAEPSAALRKSALEAALSIIGEYLSDEWFGRLCTSYELDAKMVNAPGSAAPELLEKPLKRHLDEELEGEAAKPKKAARNLNIQKLAASSKNSKSITSFFQKK
eukprot:NODE_2995_length_1070_cov_74.506366_g2747_i0.p1 GENE.NODE_2995_length_1070_cov_74.506366_g2747_i0~~NODE_2995_length_1070_cov_74.506366_g2747_i0.p1  ORF type:complete len:327 (+),score=76.93 NODE_2995_length_1070_cov_74.506366_g2747_i0:53-982(+)